MALPMSNGLARAFVACPVAGGAPLTFAGCLPISYAEILRLDLKISLVRTLAALPAALAFGAALAWQIKLPLLIGILAALKVAFCVMALRPLMVSASFSAGTNDTQLSKFRGWVMFVLVVSIAFVSLGLAVASVIVTNWWSLILMFVFALLSWGFHAIHRRRYDRMGFDLQPSTLVGQHPVG